MTDTAEVLIADVTPAQAEQIAAVASLVLPHATVEVHAGDTFPTAREIADAPASVRLRRALEAEAGRQWIDTNDPAALMAAITAAGLEHEIAYRIDLAESDRAAGR